MRPIRTILTISIVLTLLTATSLGVGAQASEADLDPMGAASFTAIRSSMVERPGTETVIDGVTITGGAELEFTIRATDPRISGKEMQIESRVVSYPQVGTDKRPGIGWGVHRIENEAGAWVGTHRTFSNGDELHWNETSWLVGEGAYEGLTAVINTAVRANDWSGLLIEGVIFPGEPPQPEVE